MLYVLVVLAISAFLLCFVWLYKLADLESKFEFLKKKVNELDFEILKTRVSCHQKAKGVNEYHLERLLKKDGEYEDE